MGKIDLTAMKRQRQEQEIEAAVPEALEQSYAVVWGKNKEKIELIELNRLTPFEDTKGRAQPFRISPDKVEQIKLSAADIGIVTPLIVRKYNGNYQIISGHHRFIAAQELNLLTVPCVVRDISDDEAVKYAVECNIQRSKLLPTEYAEIYSRYMEIRHNIDMTAQEIADKFGISKKSLYRYIKILDLTDNLRSLIDNGMLHTDTAEIFSEFSIENQEAVYIFITENEKKVNRAFAKEIQAFINSFNGELVSSEQLNSLLVPKEKEPKETAYKSKTYSGYEKKYKVSYSEKEWDNLISSLLEQHFGQSN